VSQQAAVRLLEVSRQASGLLEQAESPPAVRREQQAVAERHCAAHRPGPDRLPAGACPEQRASIEPVRIELPAASVRDAVLLSPALESQQVQAALPLE